MADYYGKRRIIQYGLLLLAVSALGTLLASTYGWFLAARLVSALSGGFIVGNTLALTGTLFAGEQRRQALSWVTAGTASAPIVGVPLLALLASFSSWREAYAAVAIMSLVVLLLVYVCVPDDTQRRAERFSTAAFLAAYRPLLRSRPMLRIYTASALRAASWVGLLTYLGAFLGDTLELSVREIGWAYMLGGVGYFTGTKLAGARLGGLDLRLLYGGATVLMGVLLGLAFMLPPSGVLIAAALTLAAAFSGIGWVTLVTLMSAETPAGQASTMSLNAVLFALGSGLGGFAGGALLALGGYDALGIGLLVFSVAGGLLIWNPLALLQLLRKRRPAIQPPS
jgi:predicted MFS family arabinose efflux permease